MPEMQTVDPSTIREFIVDTFLFGDADGLEDDTSFMGSGLIDSMGILKVANFIERTYDIKLRPDQFIPDNLDSVNNIAGFVSRTLSADAVGASDSE